MPVLMGALLVVAVVLAYRPVAGAGFVWDDDDYVTQNATLRTGRGFVDIWTDPSKTPQYYPLVFTTFWLEFRAWGLDPRAYHEVNVLFHAVSAVLVWRLLRRLRTPGAFLAALIFAVHPVMVESVAWVTERKNTLSLFFYLLAMSAYLRFDNVDPNAPKAAAQRPWTFYAAAILLFACALLSKTVTASWPATMLLILWWKRGRIRLTDVALLVPFFVLGAGAAWLTGHLERTHVGAGGAEWAYTPVQRTLIAGRAVWFYAAKLLLPVRLTFTYPKWHVDPAAWWQWIFPAGVVAALASLFALRRKLGRGPVAAALIFVGTLVPALGFVNVFPMRYTFVADHYQYHASIAMIALVVGAMTALSPRFVRPPFTTNRARAAEVLIVLLLFVLTWRQSSIYVDRRTLWTDTVTKDPDSWLGWTQLGNVAATATPPQHAEAARCYRRALELAPDVPETHYNVAQAYIDERNYPAALAELDRTIAIEPRFTDAYFSKGHVLQQTGDTDRAIAAFAKTIDLEPEHVRAHVGLGRIYRDRADWPAAIEQLTRAVRANPRDIATLFLLAECHVSGGQLDAGRADYEAIIAVEPDNADAHFRLGVLLQKLGRVAESQPHLHRALTLRPELRKLLPGAGR